jgi:hypothetical protein
MSVLRRVLCILIFLVPIACGSSGDKGKNKDKDVPKPALG